jgi:hypothetical protein
MGGLRRRVPHTNNVPVFRFVAQFFATCGFSLLNRWRLFISARKWISDLWRESIDELPLSIGVIVHFQQQAAGI